LIIEPIKGAPEAIIVEVTGLHAFPQQPLDGFVLEELRHEVQPAVGETEAV